MWVARDKDGVLTLFIDKPQRMEVNWSADCVGILGGNDRYYSEDPIIDKIDGFERLKWEDEPIEVALIPIDISLLKSFTEEKVVVDADKLPIQCQLCSVHHCMEPKGKDVCEFYCNNVFK